MVDFKKLHDDWWNSLTDEQKTLIKEKERLVEENTYYTTETLMDNDYYKVKCNKERKEEKQEVKLYRPIYNDNTVSEKILLSFGGFREYGFDERFVSSTLEKLEDGSRRFCIDAGGEAYVKNEEMKRIINESVTVLDKLGIHLVDDYYAPLTNSDMGKMIQGLGLL